MGLKASGTGAFLIPTAPAVGTTVTGGAANTFTTNAVQLIASTGAAIFITGLYVQLSSTSKPTYVVVRLSTGASDGSIVGEFVVPYAYTAGATGTQMSGYVPINPPIAVATSTRIGCKTADSVGALGHTVILQCINQSNVVDDGIAVGTVTNLTNAPTAGDFTTVMKTSIGTAVAASAVASVTGNVGGNVTGSVGSISGVTFPTNFSSLVIDATGRVNAFLIGILTTVFTEGAAGRIAAAFKQFFNIASPAATMDHGILVDTVTTYTGNTPQTGDAYAKVNDGTIGLAAIKGYVDDIGVAGAGLTALGDTRLANLDATVSSRGTGTALDAAGVRSAVGLASANLDTQLTTIDDFLDTEIAAIKAKTDNLPAAPAATGDCITAAGVRAAVGLASANLDTQLSTIDDYIDTEMAAVLAAVDTEVAAIKAKTDNLPASPAATGDIPTADITAIKAKTDNLPSDPADASDISSAFSTVNSSLSTIAGYIDTEVGAIKAKTDNLPAAPAATGDCITAAGVRAAVGLASANLDTQLTAIDDYIDTEMAAVLAAVDTEVAAIKTKTDQLTFTKANELDANLHSVNDVTVTGDGTEGNEWGPA